MINGTGLRPLISTIICHGKKQNGEMKKHEIQRPSFARACIYSVFGTGTGR